MVNGIHGNYWRNLAGLLVLYLITGVSLSGAETTLRFSPPDTTVYLGDTASLSVHLDSALEVRTFEVFVHHDPDILTSIGGLHGQIFSDAGAYIFEEWVETAPGYWHGFAIVMDARHWAVGPGELYVWTFTADLDGFCPVMVDSVVLYTPDASLISDVSLPSTTVNVFDPALSPVETPRVVPQPFAISPNPFNPGTVLTLDVQVEGQVRVEVFDCRGRNMATVWSGWSDGQPLRVFWDGRDRGGHPLASGVYLFRLEGPGGIRGLAGGTLVK